MSITSVSPELLSPPVSACVLPHGMCLFLRSLCLSTFVIFILVVLCFSLLCCFFVSKHFANIGFDYIVFGFSAFVT